MFTVTGRLDDDRETSIAWYPLGLERMRAKPTNRRGLVGDQGLIERAIVDELDGRTFRATQTGPFLQADLDDAHAALLQLASYFQSGYTLDGDLQPRVVYPVGEGAVG